MENVNMDALRTYMAEELVFDGDDKTFLTPEEVLDGFYLYCDEHEFASCRHMSQALLKAIKRFVNLDCQEHIVRRKYRPAEKILRLVICGVRFKNPVFQQKVLQQREAFE